MGSDDPIGAKYPARASVHSVTLPREYVPDGQISGEEELTGE